MQKNCVRIIAFFLCLSVLLSGCGSVNPVEETTKDAQENVDVSTEQEESAFGELLEPVAYKEGHYYLDDLEEANCLKRFGRTQFEEHLLTCDWSACGIGFRIKSEGGSMTIGYKTSYDTYFGIWVDGEKVSHEPLSQGAGVIRFKVTAGDHEIEIRKENEINISQQSYCYLTEIGLKNGGFYARPEDKELFIEIIGDSIACGDGCLGVFDPDHPAWYNCDHSALSSFAAVCANYFDADFSLVARGGIGVLKSRDEVGLPMPKIYPYISPYRDTTHEYDFSRKPDLIIYELSANDGAFEVADYYAATCEFLDEVYERYGKDIPIVWTAASTSHYEVMEQYAAEHPDIEFYRFRYSYGSSGAGGSSDATKGHPNVQEQQEYGEALAIFIEMQGILKKE